MIVKKKHNSLGKFECWYILPETKATSVTLGVNAPNSLELKNIIDKGAIESFLIDKEIKPDDLVIATGKGHSIRQLVEMICQKIGIEIHWHGHGLDEIGLDQNEKVKIKVSSNLIRNYDPRILVGSQESFIE